MCLAARRRTDAGWDHIIEGRVLVCRKCSDGPGERIGRGDEGSGWSERSASPGDRTWGGGLGERIFRCDPQRTQPNERCRCEVPVTIRPIQVEISPLERVQVRRRLREETGILNGGTPVLRRRRRLVYRTRHHLGDWDPIREIPTVPVPALVASRSTGRVGIYFDLHASLLPRSRLSRAHRTLVAVSPAAISVRPSITLPGYPVMACLAIFDLHLSITFLVPGSGLNRGALLL